MACSHKFINDLLLQYTDWEVRTLFVGTFNPAWEVCSNNYASWFYGRTANNDFWNILSLIHGEATIDNGNRNEWIEFCRRNNLAVTDVLKNIIDADEQNVNHQRAICKFKDDELTNFQVQTNDIPRILRDKTEITQVCITRQTLPLFWERCFSQTFEWINNHPERNITVKFLRSPSRGARKGVAGNFTEFVANRWIQQQYEII